VIHKLVTKIVLNTVRKALLIFASELIGNPIGYAILGVVNNLGGGRLITVFLEYPATRSYVSAVTFPGYAIRARWQPRFAGIYSPAPGKWGLVLAISSLEQDLVKPENSTRLLGVVETLERVKSKVGAQHICLAGVLPSILRERNLYQSDDGRGQIAAIVEQAIYETVTTTGLQDDDPVILLGGAGYIGIAVHEHLETNSQHPLVVIDAKITNDHSKLIRQLVRFRNQRVLLVNVARNGVLDLFLPHLWSQLVILNEVFPAAERSVRTKLAEKGVAYYHLAGVRGFALPKFAGPYAGAVPCCAVVLENATQLKHRLVIRKL